MRVRSLRKNCSREAMWPSNCCHIQTGGDGRRRNDAAISQKQSRRDCNGKTRSRDVSYHHAEILKTTRWLEVPLFPVDHNPQVGSQLEKVPVVQKKLPLLCNHQPVVQVTEETHAPPMRPL